MDPVPMSAATPVQENSTGTRIKISAKVVILKTALVAQGYLLFFL